MCFRAGCMLKRFASHFPPNTLATMPVAAKAMKAMKAKKALAAMKAMKAKKDLFLFYY